MKLTLLILSVLLTCPNFSAYAQNSAVPVNSMPVAAQLSTSAVGSGASQLTNENTAGVAAAVRGVVNAKRPGEAQRLLASGDAIYVGDEITSGQDAGLQILFRDETSFTISANSVITIDEFVYDPLTRDGKVTTRVSQGIFRFISGSIAKKNPEKMNVILPGSATIGVRGTIAAGQTDGNASTVILMGPGPNNNTGSKIGSIIVGNQSGGKERSVHLKKNGFGTRIEGPESAPSAPYEVPASELTALAEALGAPSSPEESESHMADQGDGGPSGTQQAGQDTFIAAKELSGVKGEKGVTVRLTNQANQSALDQVRSTSGGIAHISQSNVPFSSSGTYNINVEINFNNRSIGGNGSSVNGVATLVDSDPFIFRLPKISFPKSSDALFTNIPDTKVGGQCTNCTANVSLHSVKDNPSIGSLIQHTVTVTNGTQTDTGNGITEIRAGGLQ